MPESELAQPEADYLIWIDLEMSGLDPINCTILEIATIITDADLKIIAEGPEIIIHQPDSVLDAMDEWNTEHHGNSGLTQAVKDSTVSLAEAEAQTLASLKKHCIEGLSPLCGNSIGNDKNFITRYMPKLLEFFHYRVIDASSVKELARRWYGDEVMPTKSGAHRALDDIKESIAELAHYRSLVFRPSSEVEREQK